MSAADSGHWAVMHPGELVATFLLPLPDPIPLEDGTVLPTYRPLEHATIQVLDPWLDQLWLRDLDGSDVVPAAEMRPHRPDREQAVNWSNKVVLHTSIQFHQTSDEATARVGLEPAMRVAAVVSGSRLSREEKGEALAELAAGSRRGAPGFDEMGLGAVTVAECYVGLRIVCDVPELDSPVLLGQADDAPFGPAESDRLFPDEPAMWPWRIFDPGQAPDPELVARRMGNALEVALAELRSIQRAVQALRRTPTAVVTRERLPFLVPVVLRRAGDIADENKRPETVLFAPHPFIEPLLPPDPLNGEGMLALNEARRRLDGGAFAAHLDLHREAHVALDRLGDHRLAALLTGIAAESLLDELVLHLSWEEGVTPEQAASNWVDGLDSRVRKELPRRLGGSWDVTLRTPVGAWAQDVAALRHRVVHGAYIPSEAEAHGSFAALNALVAHLCDRLATPAVLKRYPRTALALAGQQGLVRRSAYTRRIRDLANDPSEVVWIETFHRWREAWRRTRQDQAANRRVPDQDGAWLIAVRHADRSLVWVRHDREQHLAVEVIVEDEGDLIPSFVDRVHAVADSYQGGDPRASPVSTAYLGAVSTSYKPGALWVEEYHHVPMTQVMVDGSDYQQPADAGISPRT